MSSLSLPSSARLTLPRWLPLLAVFLVAIVVRHFVVDNADVSWGLTMADKVLDGERLYVDIIEVNPPATVFLYIVPAMLARFSGLPATIFADALVFLAAGLSLWVCSRILRQAGMLLGDDGWVLATIAAAALLILPAQTFGEREHIALIAFLPLLAVGAVRARGVTPDLPKLIMAGLCGAAIVIIKPYYAAPIICTAAVAAYHARSWRPLFALENWIAVVLLAAYAAMVAMAFPQFIADVMPLVLTVYVPVKATLARLAINFAVPLWLAALGLIVLLKRRALAEPPFSLLLAASLGFAIAFFGQRKGWPYQSYPMLALALIALARVFIEHWQREPARDAADRPKRLASALATGLIMGTTFCWMNFAFDSSKLAAAVRAIKPHPKLIALSTDLSVGFPLTRTVEGTWVGRTVALWITGGVWFRQRYETLDPATKARLQAYEARDRAMLTADIVRHHPDVILVSQMERVDWLAWASADPTLAAELQAYRPDKVVDDMLILRRVEAHWSERTRNCPVAIDPKRTSVAAKRYELTSVLFKGGRMSPN